MPGGLARGDGKRHMCCLPHACWDPDPPGATPHPEGGAVGWWGTEVGGGRHLHHTLARPRGSSTRTASKGQRQPIVCGENLLADCSLLLRPSCVPRLASGPPASPDDRAPTQLVAMLRQRISDVEGQTASNRSRLAGTARPPVAPFRPVKQPVPRTCVCQVRQPPLVHRQPCWQGDPRGLLWVAWAAILQSRLLARPLPAGPPPPRGQGVQPDTARDQRDADL